MRKIAYQTHRFVFSSYDILTISMTFIHYNHKISTAAPKVKGKLRPRVSRMRRPSFDQSALGVRDDPSTRAWQKLAEFGREVINQGMTYQLTKYFFQAWNRGGKIGREGMLEYLSKWPAWQQKIK